MTFAILFIFGLVIGSFLNVVALRYDGEKFVADPKVIGGRSHCPHCGKTLEWFELIPIVSFVIQRRRCRGCKAKIGFQYPLVEFLSACIFAFVPLQLTQFFGIMGPPFGILSALWIFAFEILLLISYIDLRLGIIPDELNVLLGIMALFTVLFARGYFGPENYSWLGPYGTALGFSQDVFLSHVVAAFAAGAFFWLLVAVTRGKGMGFGDVKLAFPLGLLFGWPDIALLTGVAFIIGAVIGLGFIAARKKTMKGSLPFAPFLAVAAAIVFWGGYFIVGGYARLIGF